MSISFNAIPINIRVPGQYIEIDNSKAVKGLSGLPTKVLVIGQKLAAGTQPELTPMLITSIDQAKKAFGVGSQLAHMLEKFINANSFVEVHAIAQNDNGTGAAATGSIAFTGPATEAGTLSFYIAGRLVQVGIAASDTSASIATALVAAIAANSDLPVTAAVDGVNTSKVNITAKHKGENGKYIDLRVNYFSDQVLPTGLVATIVDMTGGTGNPVVTAALDAIGDEWYTDFVMAYSDAANVSSMKIELADRFGPLQMIDGYCYIGLSDTHANLITKGQTPNSPHIVFMGVKKGPTPPYELAAVLGAQCAYFGNIDPARPLQTLSLPGVLAPKVSDRFTMAERNLLLYGGISTFRVDAGNNMVIERIITTYRTNPFGATDPSFLNLETMKTLTYLRYDTRTMIALRYPRYKLADDGTDFARGQAVVTPSVIRSSLIARFKLWEESGLVEGIEQFKQDLIVERDSNDPDRVNALIPPDIINQFRVFAGNIQFGL